MIKFVKFDNIWICLWCHCCCPRAYRRVGSCRFFQI